MSDWRDHISRRKQIVVCTLLAGLSFGLYATFVRTLAPMAIGRLRLLEIPGIVNLSEQGPKGPLLLCADIGLWKFAVRSQP